MCGREWTLDALMAEIEKERDVMLDSGGGVTLCGGEPLMHADYILPLLQELGHRGFHRAVDTTLHAPWQTVARVAAECDLWLVDLKLMDSAKHQQYTGVANELILENLRRLAQSGARILIRIPLIEGINADEENIAATARFLSTIRSAQSDAIPVFHTPTRSLSLAENSQSSILNSQFPTVHLLPYHDVGKDKHRRMWSRYNPQHIRMEPPSEETIQRCAAQLNDSGLHVVIGG
jgi:pyruvate formate lyase activating enzyme